MITSKYTHLIRWCTPIVPNDNTSATTQFDRGGPAEVGATDYCGDYRKTMLDTIAKHAQYIRMIRTLYVDHHQKSWVVLLFHATMGGKEAMMCLFVRWYLKK